MSFINKLNRNQWLSIALIHFFVVAILGMTLRSKILFNIPFIDFKYVLHAHSHFAFGGWVSMALMALMVFDILPKKRNRKPVYKWLLAGIFLNAWGMLISFIMEGYAFFSIFFSTVFIFINYAFSVVFIRDILKTEINKVTVLLCIASLMYMSLSSVGPFTLAYLMATKSTDTLLYRDAIYTYLHLQYNGFFTLAVFALSFNRIQYTRPKTPPPFASGFAFTLVLSVIPSMFLCYMWHHTNSISQGLAIAGSVLLLVVLFNFFAVLYTMKKTCKVMDTVPKMMISLSFIAFILKTFFQSLTVFQNIGELVFTNRPIIIGFLHLVLLGFVSMYLLAHIQLSGIFKNAGLLIIGSYSFAGAVILNELLLMIQGVGIMTGYNSNLYALLLWIVSILLLISSGMVIFARFYPVSIIPARHLGKNNLLKQYSQT